jgi:hypothetical protein
VIIQQPDSEQPGEDQAKFSGEPQLARRYERKGVHFLGFAQLAGGVICYRRAIKLDLLTHNNPE